MLCFCPSKINLGLAVIEKRADGFHNIETVFYPIGWSDALEVIIQPEGSITSLKINGLSIEGDSQNNTIIKAYELLKNEYALPPVAIYLYKNIPMGAGLGGGSSNASNFINAMDKLFELNMPLSKKINIARDIGSDCAFFIEAKPVYATQKGDVFDPINLNLDAYYIAIVYPNIHSNTKIAYQGVTPNKPQLSIKTIIETLPIEEWKTHLVNDFENSVFKAFPEINNLKDLLYSSGAIYASMSGSGSAVFGIFKEQPILNLPKEYLVFVQEPRK